MESEVRYGPDGKALRDDGGKLIREKHIFVPRTRQQIEIEVDKKIEQVRAHTNISFGNETPHATNDGEIIPLNWINPITGEKQTPRMMSIIEAHEKGHVVRYYRGKEFNTLFRNAIDQASAETLYDEEYYQKLFKGHKGRIPDFELAKEMFFLYIFSAAEIVERMSQMKNYFSMHGDELFTKEHLDHAREHYITDTGLDNGMTFLFKAITPEKEGSFLHLVNSAGI